MFLAVATDANAISQNLALKDTLEYLKKSANDAMSFMEEQVKQCASDVQMWRQASTNAHDITMLLAKAGETIHLLPKMQVTDILLRWVEYHVKQSRRLVIVDGLVVCSVFVRGCECACAITRALLLLLLLLLLSSRACRCSSLEHVGGF